LGVALMIDLLLLFVPFFALVLMGWGAARSGLLALGGIGTMNTFVLFFGLPAMVFRLSASGALQQPGLFSLLLAYGLAGGLMVLLGLAWAVHAGLSRRDGGLVALVTAFPNTGFLGLPLLTSLLGAQAAGPVAATLVIDVLILSSLCLAWAHSKPEHGAHDGAWQAIAASLKGALRNPLLWSMAAGLAVSLIGLTLPHAVDETLRLLSLSASPAALFTLGAMLARSQVAATPQATIPSGRVAVWALLKLVAHPAGVWLFAQALSAAGIHVPTSGLLTLMLAAALPSASNVSMLAEREGANTALVARIILWTTAAALLTISGWAHGLGVR
jgi:malonate transporter